MDATATGIEQQKENIPLRATGYDANALVNGLVDRSESLGAPALQGIESFTDFKHRIEQVIEAMDDPIQPYLERIERLHAITLPEARKLLKETVTECALRFRENPVYQNNISYLRVWLEFAQLSSDPLLVFKFIAQKRIGLNMALFYEEYAKLLCQRDWIRHARDVFVYGIQEHAQPLQRLLDNFEAFKTKYPDAKGSPTEPEDAPLPPPTRPLLTKRRAARQPLHGSFLPRKKLQIYVDDDEQNSENHVTTLAENPVNADALAALLEPSKENVMPAQPWVNETLPQENTPPVRRVISVWRDGTEQAPAYDIAPPSRNERWAVDIAALIEPEGPRSFAEIMIKNRKPADTAPRETYYEMQKRERAAAETARYKAAKPAAEAAMGEHTQQFMDFNGGQNNTEWDMRGNTSTGGGNATFMPQFSTTYNPTLTGNTKWLSSPAPQNHVPSNLAPSRQQLQERVMQEEYRAKISEQQRQHHQFVQHQQQQQRQQQQQQQQQHRLSSSHDLQRQRWGRPDQQFMERSPMSETSVSASPSMSHASVPVPKAEFKQLPPDFELPCHPLNIAHLPEYVDPTNDSLRLMMRDHLAAMLEPVPLYRRDQGFKGMLPSLPKKPSKNSVNVDVDIHGMRLHLQRLLGVGGFGVVYRAQVGQLVGYAVKIEKGSVPWELYHILAARTRIKDPRILASLVEVVHHQSYTDEQYTIMPHYTRGTLLKVTEVVHNSEPAPKELERLAAYFAIELLRVIEVLHQNDIIHGDIKPENVMLRTPAGGVKAVGNYMRSSKVWDQHGVVLLDFGRAIDLRLFPPNQRFTAGWDPDKQQDCWEICRGQPYTYETDYHGVANIVYRILALRPLVVTLDSKGRKVPKHGLPESRDAMNVGMWSNFFNAMLNPPTLPSSHLEEVRVELENWLVQNSNTGKTPLTVLLGRLSSIK